MATTRDLPFVYINVATTADGKLAPANRQFVPFGSKRDQELLLKLRARADAVMSGARTVGPMPVNLGPGPARYRKMRLRQGLPEYNLRIVVSGSGNLNPHAEIFRHRFSPIIVLVTHRAPESNLRRLRNVADEVRAFGDEKLNFAEALRWLRQKWGVKKLLCEGGGEVNAGLFVEGLVDEVHHTLCPLVFGGRHAPTMADGDGFPTLASAARLRLKSLKRVGDELFLIWRTIK
jgi:2,5-diamino-6-(ribosylamino)-4(3H)-pyrimidinone 5'-phosphate reductase